MEFAAPKLKFLSCGICVILECMENEKPKPEPTGKFAEVHKKSREVREKKNQARREELEKAAAIRSEDDDKLQED